VRYYDKIENKTSLIGTFNTNTDSDSRFDFYFSFPPDFSKELQNSFLDNFKNDEMIVDSNYTIIDSKTNFSDFWEDHYNPNKPKQFRINIFDNENDITKYYRSNYDDDFYYSQRIKLFGIIFTSQTDYKIRFKTYSDLYDNLVYTGWALWDEYFNVNQIQFLVDRALLRTYINSPNYHGHTLYKTTIERNEYSIKEVVNDLQDYLPFFMLFYFVPCVCTLLNNLVIEKESKIKESLIIVGLKRSSFWVSWATTYGIIIIFSSVLVTIAMVYSSLFTYINWSILIFSMLIYGLSCCSISFILSTLIQKSKTANTLGVMIILIYFAMYFVNRVLQKMPNTKWFCVYTVSPISFLVLFDYLFTYENQKLYINIFNMFSNNNIRNSFFGLLFTLIIYFLIAVYLDNVLPQGNNFHKKWHFFISDFFHKKKERPAVMEKSKNDNPYIQNDPEGLRKAVEVRNICKNFKVKNEKVEILKNISFSGYYDEIFSILGHNGAGKTTLISIMTGILSPTYGDVYYDDIPITGNETEVCKQFGYCPQFDTFNNNLTVGEHVKLFAGIKNVQVDVKEVLKDIDLLEKEDNYPKELSGGQRRKLCITLALLGSPKFVFLDEPTTGLDPYSRKNIWELLSRKKKGCIMFITTHYMDEADLLSDRKMIISNGKITCLGTSLFLKNSFNMNYSLDIHVKETSDSSLIDNIIEKLSPESIKSKTITNSNVQVHESKSNGGSHEDGLASENLAVDYIITYLLPMKLSKDFKEIFESLNQLINDENNSITNFSLTAPTLEELFIKLENNSGNMELENIKSSAVVVDMDKQGTEVSNNLNTILGKKANMNSSNLRQICAIVLMRLKIFIRNKTFALLYTLLPIILIIIIIYFENKIVNTINTVTTYDPLEINSKIYNKVTWFKDTSSSSGRASDIIKNIESSLSLESVDYDNQLTIKSGKLTSDLRYIGGFKGIESDDNNLQFVIYKNNNYEFATAIGMNQLHNGILKYYEIDKQIKTTYHPFDNFDKEAEFDNDDSGHMFNIYSETLKQTLEPVLIVAMAIAISLSISIFGPLTVQEREIGIKHQLLLNGTKRINYWIGVIISDFICLFVPVILVAIAGMVNDISIYNAKVIFYTFICTLIWGFSSLLHQYIVSYFFKKYEKVSSLFIILNPILTLFIGVYSLVVAIITASKIYDEDIRFSSTEIKYYIILVLFAPASIVLFYSKLSIFISFTKLKFNDTDITTFLLSKDATEILSNTNLNDEEKNSKLTTMFFNSRMPSLSEIFNPIDRFLLLIIAGVVITLGYALILFLLEKYTMKLIKKNNEYTPEERKIRDEKLENGPKDVYLEWKKVKEALNGTNPNNNIALKVFQLNKDFFLSIEKMKKAYQKDKHKKSNRGQEEGENNNKTAFQRMDDRTIFSEEKKLYINRIVNDVTFGVNVGECLGLLGPNGAGKTTSISMITGTLSHTHGQIVYGDKDLNTTEMADLSLGYCSQYDALWKLLTVKETIQFYLNICGYPKSDIPQYTKALIDACGIENHTNKKVSEISGGTKRKLSLIVAICSSPSYLILDEPSAGMDPFTRRYIWKLISQLKRIRETATILTTHSTEEAEALCERIAILIKGSLVCVDTPKSIKMNHSNTYTLEVFTDNPKQFEDDYVKRDNLFGLRPNEDYELETSISYQKYSITMKTENIANVFAQMEKAKESGLVSQYNFGQYSLEQVFINFVNSTE